MDPQICVFDRNQGLRVPTQAAKRPVQLTRGALARLGDSNGVAVAVAKLAARDDLAAKRGRENEETVLIDGYLATQPAKPSAAWPLRFYALTSSALYQAEQEYSNEALKVFLMEPTCSVYLTRLYANAFELVTTAGALHLYGAT